MDTVGGEHVAEVPAHDDEITLREVLDVHHAPDQGKAIGGQREDGADHDAIHEQLNVEHGCVNQHHQVV